MNLDERYAYLRRWLQTPSREHWRCLLELLREWPADEGRTLAMEYSHQHLKQWPAYLFSSPLEHPSDAAMSSQLLQNEHLAVHKRDNIREVREFLESPRAENLRSLDLSSTSMKPPQLLYIASLESLPNLEVLNLRGCRVGDAFVQTLLTNPAFSSLNALNLSKCKLSHGAVRELFEQGLLSSLKELDLSKNSLSESVFLNVDHPAPLQWEMFDFSCNQWVWQSRAFQTFFSEELLPHLKHLNLSGNTLNGETVVVLAKNTLVRKLDVLRLGRCFVGKTTLERFLRRFEPEKMSHLDLSNAMWGDSSARMLTWLKWVKRVEQIELGEMQRTWTVNNFVLQKLEKDPRFSVSLSMKDYLREP